MNFLSLLSGLGLLLAATAAQPKPCVSPALMSGGFSVSAADGLIFSQGSISYDSFSQKVRVRNSGMVGNETFALDQLMLFKEKVYYEIDWRTFSCKKKALDTSFDPMGVPSDAKLMGQVFLGSSSSWGMGVLVNTWSAALPNNGYYMAVFSEVGCIPMTFMGFTPSSGWTTVSTFNWVIGNTNPMDYIPPFICNKARLEESEAPDTMFTALESLARKTRTEE